MKVILDFPNLREGPDNSKYLQNMAEMAKEAKGFVFFADYGDNATIQICHLNVVTLAEMIRQLESQHPKIKEINKMSRMFKEMRK